MTEEFNKNHLKNSKAIIRSTYSESFRKLRERCPIILTIFTIQGDHNAFFTIFLIFQKITLQLHLNTFKKLDRIENIKQKIFLYINDPLVHENNYK